MQTDGLHHSTAVTGDSRENTQFYTRTPGLGLFTRTAGGHDATADHREYHTRPETAGRGFEGPGDGGTGE